jgi:hypothetical protein
MNALEFFQMGVLSKRISDGDCFSVPESLGAEIATARYSNGQRQTDEFESG